MSYVLAHVKLGDGKFCLANYNIYHQSNIYHRNRWYNTNPLLTDNSKYLVHSKERILNLLFRHLSFFDEVFYFELGYAALELTRRAQWKDKRTHVIYGRFPSVEIQFSRRQIITQRPLT